MATIDKVRTSDGVLHDIKDTAALMIKTLFGHVGDLSEQVTDVGSSGNCNTLTTPGVYNITDYSCSNWPYDKTGYLLTFCADTSTDYIMQVAFRTKSGYPNSILVRESTGVDMWTDELTFNQWHAPAVDLRELSNNNSGALGYKQDASMMMVNLDYNTYKTPGVYYGTTATSVTRTNQPYKNSLVSDRSVKLTVSYTGQNGSSATICQVVECVIDHGVNTDDYPIKAVYRRYCVGSTWTTWACLDGEDTDTSYTGDCDALKQDGRYNVASTATNGPGFACIIETKGMHQIAYADGCIAHRSRQIATGLFTSWLKVSLT